MIKSLITALSLVLIALFSSQICAQNIIQVTVTTTEKAAAGIGFSVEGKNRGGMGKSYEGTGPQNKQYTFGYRKKSIVGVNISCGTLTLTKNSKVVLVSKNDKCHSVLN
jgi:hypothetical protein